MSDASDSPRAPGRREAEEVLFALLRNKEDAGQAEALIHRLIEVNDSTQADTIENLQHVLELRGLYREALTTITSFPDDWRPRLRMQFGDLRARASRRKRFEAPRAAPKRLSDTHTFMKAFDGTTAKTVVSAAGEKRSFKREPGGEFMPVVSDDDQLSDTAMLLQLVATEDYETIERLGYKVKRRGLGELGGLEQSG